MPNIEKTPSPEEMTEIQKEQIENVTHMIKKGAEPEFDKELRLKNLDATEDQKNDAWWEMNLAIKKEIADNVSNLKRDLSMTPDILDRITKNTEAPGVMDEYDLANNVDALLHDLAPAIEYFKKLKFRLQLEKKGQERVM